MKFSGKTVFITGSASGIGEATARVFANEGAQVVIADFLQEEGQHVVQSIVDKGGEAQFVKLNVSEEEGWRTALYQAEKKYKSINVLINCAGISGMVPDHNNVDYLDKLTSIHIRGTFLAIRLGGKALISAGGGAIVTVSSVAAYTGMPGLHMGYCAAKAGILAMTRSAAGEYAKHGIRVNAIVPGLLPPMRTSIISADSQMRDKFFQTVPLGGIGTRNDAANAVLFLASDESNYMTGAEILLDGGLLAYRS